MECKDKGNQFIRTHNQFPEENKVKSELPEDIIYVTGCDLKQALKWAETHCNMLSFYAVLFAQGLIDMSYRTFFKLSLKDGWSNERGYIDWEKEDVLKKLNIKKKIVKYSHPKDIDGDKFYQVLLTNKHGKHFIFGYKENGVAKYSDTNYRGIDVQTFQLGDKILWAKTLED